MKETVGNEYEIENLGLDWRLVNRLTRLIEARFNDR